MDGVLAAVIIGLAALGVYVWNVQTGRAKVTDAQSAVDEFDVALEKVSVYAPVADKLLQLGEIAPDERLPYVIDMVSPYLEHITTGQLRGIIEWWLLEQKKS